MKNRLCKLFPRGAPNQNRSGFERYALTLIVLLVAVLLSATFISLNNLFLHKTILDVDNQRIITGNMVNLESAPVIEINPEIIDLGSVSQKDGKISTIFDLTNSGENNLIIEYMDTSCMCTSARIIYRDEEGPIFGMSMHGNNPQNYEVIIPPGESAQLEVIYDPLAHGIQKQPEQEIIREVTVVSNDPVNPQKKVRFRLTQTR